MTKQELREKMMALRNGLSPEEKQHAGAACASRLVQRVGFERAKTLFCYRAVGNELDLESILQMARIAGKEVAFPRVTGQETMEFVVGGVFQKGFRGIPEPQGGSVVLPTAGDLMLLPGLAFSEKGQRLGYGKGYYDRYLAALKGRPACWGVGYGFQLCSRLPAQEWDQPLDAILTPEKIIRCER